MKTRTDLLNHLINRHGLHAYLEIGVQNPKQNFDKIICPYKVGVDPNPDANATICKTSDEYFETEIGLNRLLPEVKKLYSLIFIDGMHIAEQVEKDFRNAMAILSPYGFIVLHDCNPEKEEHTIVPRPTERGHWNGDVYKFAAKLGGGLEEFITVDIDNGCGVYRDDGMNYFCPLMDAPSWEEFDKNRKSYLHLESWDAFILR